MHRLYEVFKLGVNVVALTHQIGNLKTVFQHSYFLFAFRAPVINRFLVVLYLLFDKLNCLVCLNLALL